MTYDCLYSPPCFFSTFSLVVLTSQESGLFFSRCCLFIESVDGGENMTHSSNMNRMGVCSTTKISNISFGTQNSGTNYIYEKKKSTTVYSKNYNHRSNEVPSVAFCVCASQALNPNPWINVLWLLACTSCSFALAHPIIFANHFSPYHKKMGRVVLHCCPPPLSLQPMLLMPLLQFTLSVKSILCDFITYSAFVPFHNVYYGNIHAIQSQIELSLYTECTGKWSIRLMEWKTQMKTHTLQAAAWIV